MESLKTTLLIDEHKHLKARLAPFGGWLMPIQYQGILAEHRCCRESSALFDTCHMGQFLFWGEIGSAGIEQLFSFRLDTIAVGRCRYGFLLNERGGIVDDLTVYRLAADHLMVVVNAGPEQKDFAAIQTALGSGSSFIDQTGRSGKLDLQGPRSRDVLRHHFGAEIEKIPFFGFRPMTILGTDAIVSRTGYTGELGYEIYCRNEVVVDLWRLLLRDERVVPAGLGARDLLRLEMGYSLYGSDLDETTTPLEAGLERFVDFNREFVGRDALLRQRNEGLRRTRVAFRVASRRSPRRGYEILHGDIRVGTVTSGAFSPMLGCGIGMGYVAPEAAAVGTSLQVVHEGVALEGTVVELPFYREGSLKT
ncbi:MAG TPA: glycine cleavage system aminomethyltransferase GcvT [Geobacteraceae bacterium]|nr:glycine cleavage system aminomethyltransferase GcvT [Geobacteraceae bacterium]